MSVTLSMCISVYIFVCRCVFFFNIFEKKHRFMRFNIDEWFAKHLSSIDGMTADEYTKFGAGGLGVSSNIFFAREFHRRYSSSGVSAVSLMPGIIPDTHIADGDDSMTLWLLMQVSRMSHKSVSQGAATTVCHVLEELNSFFWLFSPCFRL